MSGTRAHRVHVFADYAAAEGVRRRAACWAREVLRAESAPPGTVNVVLTGDRIVRRLHERHFGDPSPTDVVSFPFLEDGFIGEIYVSVPRARSEARARGIPWHEELCRYVVHGTLHLLGYRDDRPARRRRMWRRQEEFVAKFRREAGWRAPRERHSG
jgi:probable rRNA maturation factor